MIKEVIKYKLPCLVISIDLPFDLKDNVVVDIETTGLSEDDEVISYGYAVRDKANVITLAYGSTRWFREFCVGLTKLLKQLGFRLWAWYCSFEEMHLHEEFNELQMRAYEKKDESLSFGFSPPTDGSSVPQLWRDWVRRRNVDALLTIAKRNLYDVVIEAASLARRKLYEVINSD